MSLETNATVCCCRACACEPKRIPDEPLCPPDPTVEVAYLRALLADEKRATK